MHSNFNLPPHLVAVPRLLNTKQACEYTGFSKQWFERHRWKGTGPNYIKIGRQVRYRIEDLNGFIEEVSNAC